MRGRDVDQLDPMIRQTVHIDAEFVYRHGNHPAAIGLKKKRRATVAWRLHDHRRVHADHQVRGQIDALLEASHNDDVLGRDRHTAGRTEITCD